MKGTVSAGHKVTAQAAIDILKAGGNAYDAALAAMLASYVCEPSTTSPGGGGFLLAAPTNKTPILFDFFTQTPRHKQLYNTVDFYPVTVNFGSAEQDFHIGLGAAAVPGFIAGVCHIHQKLGKIPFTELVQPAVYAAKNGVIVTDSQYRVNKMLLPIVEASADGKTMFFGAGGTHLIPEGGKMYLPQYADFLEILAKEGKDFFYKGEIAQSIAKHCYEKGGYLQRSDFEQYQVMERTPLYYQYKGHHIYTNPPPSSGGCLINFALAMLQRRSFSNIKFGGDTHASILAHAMQQTQQARFDTLNKNLYHPSLAQHFLSEEFVGAYRSNIPNKKGCTTHISTTDQWGNAASVTTSNGEGSGFIIPNTQIMLNNMLGEEDLNPSGFHEWRCNVRLSSMMSPTIVLDKFRQLKIVTGTGGANRIRTAIFQLLHNIIDYNMPLYEATHAPRIHWEDDVLYMEGGLESEAYELTQFGKTLIWEGIHRFFGGTNTVVKYTNGEYVAVGDARRDGCGMYC